MPVGPSRCTQFSEPLKTGGDKQAATATKAAPAYDITNGDAQLVPTT